MKLSAEKFLTSRVTGKAIAQNRLRIISELSPMSMRREFTFSRRTDRSTQKRL